MKTAEQIAKSCENDNWLLEHKAINKAYREQDESHLWPINNRFNVTYRAIRNAKKHCENIETTPIGLEYCLYIEEEISKIVNSF